MAVDYGVYCPAHFDLCVDEVRHSCFFLQYKRRQGNEEKACAVCKKGSYKYSYYLVAALVSILLSKMHYRMANHHDPIAGYSFNSLRT